MVAPATAATAYSVEEQRRFFARKSAQSEGQADIEGGGGQQPQQPEQQQEHSPILSSRLGYEDALVRQTPLLVCSDEMERQFLIA